MSTEKIKTIDGKQLLNMEFEPIKFIVNGLMKLKNQGRVSAEKFCSYMNRKEMMTI